MATLNHGDAARPRVHLLEELLVINTDRADHAVIYGLPASVVSRITNFDNPRQEWRRLFAEVLGTFFLVLVAAGGGMMGARFEGSIGRVAAVTAPGLMVMALILCMGKVSGAHFNPAVTLAFSLRGDFPWRRVPGYVVAQLVGGLLACLFLQSVIDISAENGATYPAINTTSYAAFLMEVVLTLGLVSVILGTASGAQNIGVIGALGVGSYIALAGLWASPLSGASMNPIRSLSPDIVAQNYSHYWVYLAGPLLGALLAVIAAFVLRGPGGGRSGSSAAQGSLFTEIASPEKD
jgi:aquaporin Z